MPHFSCASRRYLRGRTTGLPCPGATRALRVLAPGGPTGQRLSMLGRGIGGGDAADPCPGACRFMVGWISGGGRLFHCASCWSKLVIVNRG